ncbi:MAG: hypothetical protein ABF333_14730 [Akkermansiaceae bacterium]
MSPTWGDRVVFFLVGDEKTAGGALCSFEDEFDEGVGELGAVAELVDRNSLVIGGISAGRA